jgi:hypothetical protein
MCWTGLCSENKSKNWQMGFYQQKAPTEQRKQWPESGDNL